MLASGRAYKPGDQISYYIKATPKEVAAYEAAKLASDFDPQTATKTWITTSGSSASW